MIVTERLVNGFWWFIACSFQPRARYLLSYKIHNKINAALCEGFNNFIFQR